MEYPRSAVPSVFALGLLAIGGCMESGSDDAQGFRGELLDPAADPVLVGDEDLALKITPSEGRADLLAKFRASPVDSEASILSYEWDFGDGSTSTLAEPEHTYTLPGAYEVVLTAEIDLNHIVIGLTEVVEATQTVYATATEWRASILDLDLGEGWGVDNSGLGCSGAVDCGPLKMRVPGAPDGVYTLRARLNHRPEGSQEPQPRFMVDGVVYDFVPPADGETGLYYEDIKTVVVSNHELELDWDDVDGSRVALSHIVLQPAEDYENPDVVISASVDMGELPLTVDFDVQSNVEIESYSWVFGDGEESTESSPRHTYETMGRLEVGLRFEDADGVEGLATTVVTVKPSKVNLPGLADLQQFGIWSAGFRNDAPEFNERRREELEALNVGFVGPGGVSGSRYGSSEASAASIHENLDALAAHGIVTGAEVVTRGSWYTNNENGQPFAEWVFEPTGGLAALAATDWDGDGISDLEGSVAWVYLGHEMGEYASRADRTQMVDATRQWFPNTPIYPYYGGIRLGFERAGQPHPAGGLVDEYQVGEGDSDIIGVSIPGPFVKNAEGEKLFDPAFTLDLLERESGYAAFNIDDPKLWVNTNLPGESLNSTPEDMWSAEEILDYARILLNHGGVESLSLRAYDRFEYDLAYGVNTEDPSQEEFGFIEQREAARWIGSWVKQTKAGLPILIIRQPEMQQTRPGPTVDVLYGVIGEQTDLVADVVLQLDDRDPVHDPDLDGTAPIEDVEVGTHTLHAYLADASGEMIPGTDVRVLSVHVEEGEDPDGSDDDGDADGTAGSSDTGDDDMGEGSEGTGGEPPADGSMTNAGCGCSQRGSGGATWSWLLFLGLGFAGTRRWRCR